MDERTAIELDSGPPWHLRLRLESVGLDYSCRITGGEAHVGSLSLAEWREHRARTRCLTAQGHREEEIAVFAAHRMCKAARRTVACAVGIRFDSLEHAETAEISRVACELAVNAARRIEDRRIRGSLRRQGLYERLTAAAGGLEREVADFLAVPLARLLADGGPFRPRPFGDEVTIFAPLYLSSGCTNDCSYCGFRRSAAIERVRLEPARAIEEAAALAAHGHRTLDLVTGEVPTEAFVEYVAVVVERVLRETPIGRIHLNLGTLTAAQSRRLRRAGASGYHVYQETYDPDVYLEVHASGPKRDMAARLEMPERALEAGFEALGLGILLGLGTLERELAMLAAHARDLRRRHPRARLGFSLPRIRPTDDERRFRAAREIDDETFAKAILFLRGEFPDAHLTLTTRETPELRDRLLPLGITKVSAGVSTSPGGYVPGRSSAAPQFQVRDRRSVAEVERAIRDAGLVPRFG